jgi:DNA-binding PadR family transcriptional regulator
LVVLAPVTRERIRFVSHSGVRATVLANLSGATRTPTEIARLENKHVSHVCRTISELKARGLVEVAWTESHQKHYKTTMSGYALFLAISKQTK